MTTEQLASNLLAIIDSEMYVNDFGGLQAGRDATTDIHAAMGNLQASFAQPEQEPVAHFGSAYINENGVHITTVLGPVAIPQDAKLYTTPPQRKPLTDGQIIDMSGDYESQYDHGGMTFDYFEAVEFARAIEAAHGIGDKT